MFLLLIVLVICITVYCIIETVLCHFAPIKYAEESEESEEFLQVSLDNEEVISLLRSMDNRLSHIEDWCGQIESRIKDLKHD
jgi:hypothetical protein